MQWFNIPPSTGAVWKAISPGQHPFHHIHTSLPHITVCEKSFPPFRRSSLPRTGLCMEDCETFQTFLYGASAVLRDLLRVLRAAHHIQMRVIDPALPLLLSIIPLLTPRDKNKVHVPSQGFRGRCLGHMCSGSPLAPYPGPDSGGPR